MYHLKFSFFKDTWPAYTTLIGITNGKQNHHMFIMFYKQLHIPVHDTETSFSVRIELFDFGSKTLNSMINSEREESRCIPTYTPISKKEEIFRNRSYVTYVVISIQSSYQHPAMREISSNIIKMMKSAAVAQFVRASAPQAEGWVFESQQRQTKVVKIGTAKRSALGVSVTGPRR